MPLHLNRREAHFTATVKPDISTSVFHMQVVTKPGKLYRSRPVLVDASEDTELVELPVYSDSLGKDVAVEVARRRIPEINYDLVDDRGTVLFTSAGRTFWGHLGGYTDAVTHRGGTDGLDGLPFVRRFNYPDNAKTFTPQWVTEGGSPCLRFDGRGTFISFPQGTLPRRGCFTLSFEIKPTGDINKPQVLFAHHGSYIGSLTVQLAEGKLAGSFVNEQGKRSQFEPELRMQKDEWHRVRVSYNLREIRFQLDDQKSELFECHGPGLYDTPSVFGGMGKAEGTDGASGANLGWFEGDLRALSVQHQVVGDRK